MSSSKNLKILLYFLIKISLCSIKSTDFLCKVYYQWLYVIKLKWIRTHFLKVINEFVYKCLIDVQLHNFRTQVIFCSLTDLNKFINLLFCIMKFYESDELLKNQLLIYALCHHAIKCTKKLFLFCQLLLKKEEVWQRILVFKIYNFSFGLFIVKTSYLYKATLNFHLF